MTERSSRDLTFYGGLILGGLVLVVAAFLGQIWLLARLSAAIQAIDPRPGMIHPIPDNRPFIIGLWVLVVIGLGTMLTGFFLGMAHCRRVGERAGLTGYSYSMGWTVGAFFVPLLNLYRPWVGLGEIRRAVFVAVEARQSGKRWNKFGDLSYATITVAIVVVGGIGAQIAYNLLAATPGPATAAHALAALPHIRTQILVNILFIALQGAALFTYLITLDRPLLNLSALSADNALSPPA
jgi:hypothetical protein